jgi:hypothetical protein
MLALICISLLAVSDAEALRRLDDYAGQAGDMWVEAGVPPLSERKSGSEIRVWAGGGVTGIWTGWVVTSSRIRIFSNEVVVNRVHQPSGEFRQVASQRRRDARVILRRFNEFSALNGMSVTCPVFDGIGYLIEGRHNGSYFAFYAGNPNLCSAPHAEQVASALELLWDAREDAL